MIREIAFLSYRQLRHRGAKLLGALAGVSVSIMLIFVQLGFREALYDSAISVPRSLDGTIFITAQNFETMAFAPRFFSSGILAEARGVDGVAAAIPLYAAIVQLASPGTADLSSWIFAFPPSTPAFKTPDIVAQSDLIRLPETALIDRKARNELGAIARAIDRDGPATFVSPQPARTIQPQITIKGTFAIGPTITIDGNMVTSDLNYYRLLGTPLDRVSIGVVKTEPGADPAAVKEKLVARLGGRAKVFTRSEFFANEQEYYRTKTAIGFVFTAGLIVGTMVGIVFVTQALHGIVADNMREFATLRAIGYRHAFFVRMVTFISVAISVVTFVPSTLASGVLYTFAAAASALPMSLKPAYVLQVFVLVLIMALAGAALSTRKLKNVDPVDLF